ncbi:MAG: acyl-CoA reductase [Thermoflavifilum sp.]|nr:acyl-CoA reductase [Thermoflavifilum sp.]
MLLEEKIEVLGKLGEYMQSNDPEWTAIKKRASLENPWFTQQFIEVAADHISQMYLQPDRLWDWIKPYRLQIEHNKTPRKVGIVMAGNIPMVGFHDLLCGWLSGHEIWVKYASRDRVLMPFLAKRLQEWMPKGFSTKEVELLRGCDAYIATGSQNTSRYFDYYFSRYPHIIRRNRTSVAILDGTESLSDLKLLAKDIFLYFGLGCRNVTKLYVPADYDFQTLVPAVQDFIYFMDHRSYRHNFDYYLSVYILNHEPHQLISPLILKPDQALFSPVSVVLYEYYTDKQAVLQTLIHSSDIQCIVGKEFVPFGQAQFPTLQDYADGINTLEFLLNLP